MPAGLMLIAAGIGILASKGGFSRDATEFGRRHYPATSGSGIRQQLGFGQIVGVTAIVAAAVRFTIALL
jgi:hypothetical protein